MDTNMDIPDDGDESHSPSKGSTSNSGKKESSFERPKRFGDPQSSTDSYFEECMEIGTRLRISARGKSTKRLVNRNPFAPTSPCNPNPLLRRGGGRSGRQMTGHSLAGHSQAGSSLVGLSNAAGLYRSTPFLQNDDGSSSVSSDCQSSVLPPNLPLPTQSSEPNLYVRHEQREIQQGSDHFLGTIIEQFQKLDMSTGQGSIGSLLQPSHLASVYSSVASTSKNLSTLASVQPLHLACADYIRGQTSTVVTTSQSLQLMGTSVQGSCLAATPVDLKSIVRTAIFLLCIMLQALTNRTNVQVPLESLSNALTVFLGQVLFAFKTIEEHQSSAIIMNTIGMRQFRNYYKRITEVTGVVQTVIQEYIREHNFDLGERLEMILVEEFKKLGAVLEQILDLI